jgi:SAM-dependent methyltransferase
MMNPAEFANIARGEDQFWWFRGMREMLHGMLDPYLRQRAPGRALEAGCGTGYFAHSFQQRYASPIFPVDLSPEGLRYAQGMGVERLAQADIAALPFPPAAFDLVLSLDVIVHFPRGREHRAMKELARVLSPGGLLVVRVSALDILRSRHSEFACERQRFTRRRLLDLARRAGIRVLRCTYANSLLFPVALFKFRIWEPLLRQAPSSGTAPVPGWLNRLLYGALALESRWLHSGRNFPLGQSLILIGEKVS